MGDTGNFKRDAKRRSTKSSKVNRIVSLFEIPRPTKSRGLQRANSLPMSKRPSLPLTEEEKDSTMPTGSVKSCYTACGKVQKIKEEIEEKTKEKSIFLTPKPQRKKAQSQRRKLENEGMKNTDWLKDRDKIMEDINKLQERIEDVTKEIQNSDTELEITHRKLSGDEDVFEDCEEHIDQEVLRDKSSDEEDSETPFNRSSSDTVFDRFSPETITEVCKPRAVHCKSEDNDNISYVPCYKLESVDSDEDNIIQDNEKTAFDSYESAADEDEPSNEIDKELEPEVTEENYQEPESDTIPESYTFEIAEPPEVNETIEDVDTNIQNEPIVEVDTIQWWKHKSFVQVNSDAPSQSIDAPPETNENEETTKHVQSSPVLGGRFIKNRASKRNRRTERRRTGVMQKPFSVKEIAQHFEGFKDAAKNGETENFRKSFICEMDKELENMKNDGFQEDFHISFENLTLLNYDDDDEENNNIPNAELDDETNYNELINMEELVKSEDGESPLFQTIIIFPNSAVQEGDYENLPAQDQDDLFGETLFSEDLEKGLYYLETYNADGKELIMCSVQVDRQSVDLSRFDEMKAHRNSNVLANDDRTLVLMDAAEACSLNGSKSGTDSKRNTIYSTTSGDSYEDEGIDIIENSLGTYGAARRETYCDDQGIVRIERVAPYPENVGGHQEYMSTINNYYYAGQDEPSNGEEENYYESIRLDQENLFSIPEVKKERLQYILEEIKSTERKYVADIRKVLAEYKTFLEERCPEKVDVVFANMDQLYQKQLEFLETLEEYDLNIKEVVQAFIDFEDLWRLYPRYFKNTPKANAAIKDLCFLIKEKQDKINDKLDLSAYLLTPLQRLGKYKLFLENIIKQLEKERKPTGIVQMALEIIKKYMSKGNDAVAIASILHSPLHTKDYGSFITREKFVLLKPRRLELMVFMFEGAIVFTTEDPKNMEQFVYHQSIKTNDLRIATFDDNTLHLTDYTKTKRRNSSKYTYVLDAKNSKLKAVWKEQIEDILWKQMKKIKENTLKEYQSGNKPPKKAPRSREQRSKSTGNS